MKIKTIIISITLIIPFLVSAENYSDKFIYMHGAVGYGHIKDIGTSPLRYHGTSADIISGYIHNTHKNSFELLGAASATIGLAEGYMLNHYTSALDIAYMHVLPLSQNDKFDFRLGGDLFTGTKINYSPSYQNASFNLDMLVKIALRAQIQYKIDIQDNTIHFAGINFHIKKQSYSPFLRLDIPVLIFNGRPEYAYVNENNLGIFERHYFFGGCDINAQLGIKKHLINGNLVEMAYVWQMQTTGRKDIYLFEQGSHNLAFSLYFKMN